MMVDNDYILVECDLEPLEAFVRELESHYTVQVARNPSLCTAMIPAEDSVEGQAFYLGEALVTECEVLLNRQAGYGLCLGDEPVRAYCIAVVDAALSLGDAQTPQILAFLEAQGRVVKERLTVEYNYIQRTKVDFKLMEQD
jgi:alpha-D-ribose 1-methylphosphonate 5-triphosphate synthase subunit PhnG